MIEIVVFVMIVAALLFLFFTIFENKSSSTIKAYLYAIILISIFCLFMLLCIE